MKSNRRNFLKVSGMAGIGLAGGAGMIGAHAAGTDGAAGHPQKGKHFNMSGYAAPKIETVRIGFVGLGNRGPGAVNRMSKIEGVQIAALCFSFSCDVRLLVLTMDVLHGVKHSI